MAFTDKQAAFKYVNNYQKDKYDRITVMVAKGKKQDYEAAAKLMRLSLSAFMAACADEKIKEMKNK